MARICTGRGREEVEIIHDYIVGSVHECGVIHLGLADLGREQSKQYEAAWIYLCS